MGLRINSDIRLLKILFHFRGKDDVERERTFSYLWLELTHEIRFLMVGGLGLVVSLPLSFNI